MNRIELAARRAVKALVGVLDTGYVRPGPRLLIYHQVEAGLGREMEVSRAAFEAQMIHLAEGETVAPLEIALSRPWDRSVVITFDDGYQDTAEIAFPIMRSLGLPFTLYLATESIETGRPIGPSKGAEPLSWSQVESMMSTGLVTMGAHTHTHRDLREVDRMAIERELDESNQLIESRLAVDPKHFAYPWGYWSESAHDLIVERYESAVLGGGEAATNEIDQYRVNRIPIQLSDGVPGFRSKLRHGGRSEERLRRLLKGYRGP